MQPSAGRADENGPQLKLRAVPGCPFGKKPAAESAEGLLKRLEKNRAKR
jgi:hypothetical protein